MNVSDDDNDFDGTEDPRDDLRNAAKLKNLAMSAIQQFENKLLSASLDNSSEYDDDEEGDDEREPGTVSPVPEFLDEEKEKLRDELYESLRHTFLTSKESGSQFSSRFYEQAVYLLVADRVRRNLGYYQALRRAEEEVLQNNQELGDPKALEISLETIQKLLSSMDEVSFVRDLGNSLGMFKPDLDDIVKHVIIKEFAPIRRRELSTEE